MWFRFALSGLLLAVFAVPLCPALETVHRGGGANFTPKPPYPIGARRKGEHGYGMVQIVCDGTGKVASASMAYSTGFDDLDNNVLEFAKKNWRGQPNSQWKVPVEYRFTDRKIAPTAAGTSVPGWYTPMPPYPYASMRYLESGSGVVKVATDATGRVKDATMTQSTGHSRLDDATVYYALGVWHGSANSVREIPVRFIVH